MAGPRLRAAQIGHPRPPLDLLVADRRIVQIYTVHRRRLARRHTGEARPRLGDRSSDLAVAHVVVLSRGVALVQLQALRGGKLRSWDAARFGAGLRAVVEAEEAGDVWLAGDTLVVCAGGLLVQRDDLGDTGAGLFGEAA